MGPKEWAWLTGISSRILKCTLTNQELPITMSIFGVWMILMAAIQLPAVFLISLLCKRLFHWANRHLTLSVKITIRLMEWTSIWVRNGMTLRSHLISMQIRHICFGFGCKSSGLIPSNEFLMVATIRLVWLVRSVLRLSLTRWTRCLLSCQCLPWPNKWSSNLQRAVIRLTALHSMLITAFLTKTKRRYCAILQSISISPTYWTPQSPSRTCTYIKMFSIVNTSRISRRRCR